MGLGKTVQAISVAYAYRQEWPLLIVVPSSLKYPWIEELERWIPELNPGDINLVETKSDTLYVTHFNLTWTWTLVCFSCATWLWSWLSY